MFGDIDLMDMIAVGNSILQRIDGIIGKLQVPGIKALDIGNDNTSILQSRQVYFQCSSIHRNQYVILIAGSIDLGASKMDLKTGNTCHSSHWCTNFGRIIGEG